MDQVDRVLFVDDDPDIRFVFTRVTAHAGIAADVAPDCATAVALCKQRHYAVIALDYRLPNTTGFDVYDELRLLAPDATYGLVSAQCDLDLAIEATNDYGFRFVLAKPWRSAELLSVLNRALESYWERAAGRTLERQAISRSSGSGARVPATHIVDAMSSVMDSAPEVLQYAQLLRASTRAIAERCGVSGADLIDIEAAAFVYGALDAGDLESQQGERLSAMRSAFRALVEHSRIAPLLAAVERGPRSHSLYASYDLAADIIRAAASFERAAASAHDAYRAVAAIMEDSLISSRVKSAFAAFYPKEADRDVMPRPCVVTGELGVSLG